MNDARQTQVQTFDREKVIPLMISSFNSTPYHQHIGLRFSYQPETGLCAHFEKTEQLIGNQSRKMVHGGAMSGIFDALGGVLCSIASLERYQDLDKKSAIRKLNRLCTIDLNINYHSPAKAQAFTATGTIVHQGNSIFHVSMHMHDDRNILVASANANYMC